MEKSNICINLQWYEFADFYKIDPLIFQKSIVSITNSQTAYGYPKIMYPNSLNRLMLKKYVTGYKSYFTKEQHDYSKEIYLDELLDIGKTLYPTDYHWKYIYPPHKPTEPKEGSIPKEHTIKVVTHQWKWLIIMLAVAIAFSLPAGISGPGAVLLVFLLWIPMIIVVCKEGQVGVPKIHYKTALYSKKELAELTTKKQKEYQVALERYRQEMEAYPEKITDYEKRFSKQSFVLNRYLPHIFEARWKIGFSIKKQHLEIQHNPPQRGAQENKLFHCLMTLYPGYVKVDRKKGDYYPDMVMNIKDYAYIDIEIDEPYEFKTKKEIHYKDSSDKERDDYFREEGWFVIRFAETQIIHHLDECVEIVKGLVSFVETGNASSLELVHNLQKKIYIKHWTKEEARIMAINNFREMQG